MRPVGTRADSYLLSALTMLCSSHFQIRSFYPTRGIRQAHQTHAKTPDTAVFWKREQQILVAKRRKKRKREKWTKRQIPRQKKVLSRSRTAPKLKKVVFCRVRTETYPGYLPRVLPYKELLEVLSLPYPYPESNNPTEHDVVNIHYYHTPPDLHLFIVILYNKCISVNTHVRY